ncbi:DUF2851 family protein [Ekhidna sp. To15]|uniref:DUF2851 family protein n=1 Tax=Ekhidna sp. To15 TaxID=3395267 RepID=UPI003F51E2BC
MDEQFLHYIWKYQKFETGQLQLTNDQSLKVFYPGNHNHDSGPDFEEARLKIEAIEWAGQVEIHINSSDWLNHNHQHDPSYESVILHVVWNHDKEICINEEIIPTLELKKRIDLGILEKYQQHLRSTSEILCSTQIKSLSTLNIRNMIDRVLIERLEEKSGRILSNLNETTNDWEQITYRTIAANFGFSTNKEAFIRLSEHLPFDRLKKVLQNIKSTEALLFGQAGFLENDVDDYQSELKEEFQFLHAKFQLKEPLSKVHWKFGKLRPANFPIIRLAQMSSLFHHQPQLFTLLIKEGNIEEVKKKLLVDVSDYWQSHYDFGKSRKRVSEKMGISSFENLIINSMAPLLAAYAKFTGEQKYMDRAMEILESISAESNRITKKWNALGINATSGFESQGLIQLFKDYCQKRRCLHCNIGVEILNK